MPKVSKEFQKAAPKAGWALDPEFEAVNAACSQTSLLDQILNAMWTDEDIELVCDTCGQAFVFDLDFMDDQCTDCTGQLRLTIGSSRITLTQGQKEALRARAALEGLIDSDEWKWGPDSREASTKGGHVTETGITVVQGNLIGAQTWSKCSHTGDTIIFERDGKQLFGCSSSGINEYSGKWQLIIDLGGAVNVPPTSGSSFIGPVTPERFSKALGPLVSGKSLPSEVVRLHWPDYGVPPCGLEFWDMLWTLLPAKTAVVCIGGHGRTGSCLSALMIAAGESYPDAVEHVRSLHCSKAVECFAQEMYLWQLHRDYLTRELARAVQAEDKGRAAQLSQALLDSLQDKPEASSKTTVQTWDTGTGGKGSISMASRNEDDEKRGAPVNSQYVGANSQILKTDGWDVQQAIKAGLAVRIDTDGSAWIEECNHPHCTGGAKCHVWAHQWWVKWADSKHKELRDAEIVALP
jgi:hypothetical protein